MTNRSDWKCALSVGPAKMCAEEFDRLAAAGVEELELSSGSVAPFYDILDFTHRSCAIASLAKEHGVNISSVHLPFAPFGEIDPASLDKEKRDYAVRLQTELLRAAAEAGIGIAVIHPSGEPYRDDEREIRLEAAVETIGKITEEAVKAGITVALEDLPRTCLCRESSEMKYFLDRIPELRVCYDTNHCLMQDNADYIRAVGEKIVTLHVSDYDFTDEKHWLPGKGKNDWERIISALEEVNYSGRFLYETSDFESYGQLFENYKNLTRK